MTDYIIAQDSLEDFHAIKLSWSGDRSLLYISTNHRTFGCSPLMAEQLCNGLLALLRGPFDRAISETALRLEAEDQTFRDRIRAAPVSSSPSAPNKKPTLGDL